eukprot:6447458-Amphidinium_carterae.1
MLFFYDGTLSGTMLTRRHAKTETIFSYLRAAVHGLGNFCGKVHGLSLSLSGRLTTKRAVIVTASVQIILFRWNLNLSINQQSEPPFTDVVLGFGPFGQLFDAEALQIYVSLQSEQK